MVKRRFVWEVIAGVVCLLAVSPAMGMPCQEDDQADQKDVAFEKQEALDFEVFVCDDNGEPVKGATVKPWAIGSAQGHGGWSEEATGMKPETVTTDSSGKVTVRYPKYSNVVEEVKSNLISVSVDHPDFPYVGDVHITMPRKRRKRIRLPLGSAIEVSVLLDGKPVVGDDVRAIWSGGRYFSGDVGVEIDEEKKTFRIPPIAKGTGHFLFIKLDGDSISHFTPIQHIKIDGSEKVISKEIAFAPAETVKGKLSDNVPRPVINGRVKVQTITDGFSWDEVSWSDWAPVAEDGTFEISAWPPGEAMQLVALCDGFIGKSGDRPPMIPEEQAAANYWRPQSYLEPTVGENLVQMEPMSVCRIEVKNAFGKELENVNAASNPNVGWWNGGSQIYCSPLLGASRFYRTGKYERKDNEGGYPRPFFGKSDKDGVITFELPVQENSSIWISNERYQLPAKLGRRTIQAEIERNKSTKLEVVLQPIGLDVLGDWEDLCGLVFG